MPRPVMELSAKPSAPAAEFARSSCEPDRWSTRSRPLVPRRRSSPRSSRIAEFEKAKPNERIATLEAQLADANRRASGAVLKDVITSAFFKAGGPANAADFILSKADKVFAVENGAVVGTVFDPNQPGVKLTVDAFITQQLTEADFAFRPSSGGGAAPLKSEGGARNGGKELRNPTAQQLGANANAIARGDVRVVYDNE
jgi:hypothetical protein